MITGNPIIVVHGGAATPNEGVYKEGVIEAAKAGWEILKNKGSALDAVEVAVNNMEDNPVFDAGVGSYLTLDGRVEMDASIMYGPTLEAGAVACLSGFSRPISIARKVMEETDHVLLVGEEARRFALAVGFEDVDVVTERAIEEWEKAKKALESDTELTGATSYWTKMRDLCKRYPGLINDCNTVGAVAIDSNGHVAAATSTGGITLKLPGRVGDTPLIGCGTYADDEGGAVSATGHGENIIKFVAAKTCVDYMKKGMSAQEAVEITIKLINEKKPSRIGLIAIDKFGNAGIARNVKTMARAILRSNLEEPDTYYGSIVGIPLEE